MTNALDELVAMSTELGLPANDYAILGEGNTSASADAETFWVKALGTQLAKASRDSFVRVRSAPVLEALSQPELSDDSVKCLLASASVEGGGAPSIETFLHAMCLALNDIRFVGHTHPTSAVGLLSGQRSRELFAGSLFPDQIVVLGPVFAYVPYADPGLPLALAVRQSLNDFAQVQARIPKVILMENHGVIALGTSSQEVLNITQMLVKVCRVITGSLLAGGPRFLSRAQVERINQRPDELERRKGFTRD